MTQPRLVTFTGSCGIGDAPTHHDSLRAAFDSGEAVEIDCKAVEKADLAFIQLLIAAARSGAQSGQRVRFLQPSVALRAALVRAGVDLDGPHPVLSIV